MKMNKWVLKMFLTGRGYDKREVDQFIEILYCDNNGDLNKDVFEIMDTVFLKFRMPVE